VWSLGLVLYEMLAGRPAYPELATYEQFIVHLVSRPPEPLRGLAPWVSEELAGIVHSAIEHDLNRRIQTCAELAKQLSALPTSTAANLPEATDTWVDPPAQPLEDFQEDAPQFFDRKMLESLEPSQVARREEPKEEKAEAAPVARTPDPKEQVFVAVEARATPRSWLWPAAIAVAFALVAIAAFAFR
jgi:serine/threonine protein kinase